MLDAQVGEARMLGEQDLLAALRLNNEAVPAVNRLDQPALQELLDQAELACALVRGASVKGFLLAFGRGAAYHSPNYRWFNSRFRDFLYIDRIVVAPEYRGSGIGRRLYEAAFATARARPLCCEVNLRPLNEGSLLFHRSLGFRQVGQEELDDGKLVAMLATQQFPLSSG